MKKVFKIMACSLLLVSLTGCGSNPTPSNGEESVVSLDKENYKISVDELYATLKDKYATNYLIQEIDKVILNKEYETDDNAEKYAENQMKIYRMYYENDESKLLSALQNAGYKDINEFEESLILNYKRDLATKDYLRNNISEKDIEKYYKDNVYGDITISHILVEVDSTGDMTDEEKKEAENKAQDKVSEIYKKLEEGKSFEEVAKEYSEDKATSSNGGHLGTFNKGEMTKKFNKEFEEATISLKVDEYTKKAIQSSYGYHIIYKEAEKEKPKLEEVKQSILDTLVDDENDKDDKAQYKAMIDLRESYGLKFNDEDVESQYDTAKTNWLYGKEN